MFYLVYLPCLSFIRIGKKFFHNNNDTNMMQQYLLGNKTIESKMNVRRVFSNPNLKQISTKYAVWVINCES